MKTIDGLIEEHYRDMFEDYVRIVSGRAGGMTNGEDVVQEAFSRCIKYKHSFDMNREFKKWFSYILSNALKDFNKDRRMEGMTTEFNEKHEEMYDEDYSTTDFYKVMEKEIAKKSSDDMKQVLSMYFLYGHTPIEIKEILDLNYTTIRQTTTRFRQELQEKYGKLLKKG